jgi:hypothetical protein
MKFYLVMFFILISLMAITSFNVHQFLIELTCIISGEVTLNGRVYECNLKEIK